MRQKLYEAEAKTPFDFYEAEAKIPPFPIVSRLLLSIDLEPTTRACFPSAIFLLQGKVVIVYVYERRDMKISWSF
jgi:hypothetical protein